MGYQATGVTVFSDGTLVCFSLSQPKLAVPEFNSCTVGLLGAQASDGSYLLAFMHNWHFNKSL